MKLHPCSTGLSTRAKRYLENTSIHGLRYIIDNNSHWFERIFWFIMCGLSFGGTYFLFVATWNTYINNPVSFVTETTYLDWNTSFPAVTVCEIYSEQKTAAFADLIKGPERDYNYESLFHELVYFESCSTCAVHCKQELLNCSGYNFSQLVQQFRSSCENMMSNCTWNGDEFDCCSLFQPLNTQFGFCFTINSLQTINSNKRSGRQRKLDLVSNRNTSAGYLTFRLHENADVTIHAPEEIPHKFRSGNEYWMINWGQTLSVTFQVTEIVNDPMLEEVAIEQRQCRFPSENPYKFYKLYSYSTCIMECFKAEQLKLCGCIHHMMPGTDVANRTCSIEGLACLWDYDDHLRAIRTPEDAEEDEGVLCSCLPSCTEPEYRIVSMLRGKNLLSSDDPGYGTEVSLAMESLPSQRFSRNVVRTKLDLVVSMGGAAGLFLGASLLSIVELFYYFCIRGKQTATKGPPGIVATAKKFGGIPRDALAANNSGINSFQRKTNSPKPGFYPQDYLSQNDLHF